MSLIHERGCDPHVKPAKRRDYGYWWMAFPLALLGLLVMAVIKK